ncbi:MAG: DUF748 domain-containing protein [Sulfuricurvum sp.]|uniref:DUF748 domain-containing protein n=1 Tax=Sulfuricurvum sp. TaxID=2025608 RepID=UPI0025CD00FB|nr:DUF748 domain-containing protein [Sulfuricurvum sp.]MCK9371996.1 DUF748 domain-containing protein [Sulfuricurvum sp.]
MTKKRILQSLAAVAGIYGMIGFVALPYVIRYVVPAKVAEATEGGKFSVESASFNPFTFHLTLRNVRFQTPQGGDLIALEAFSINIDPLAYLWKGGVVIGDMGLNGAKITLHRDKNGDFNYQWLSELKGDEEPEEASKPLKLRIERFTLSQGSVEYRDASEGRGYALDLGPIGFSLEHIDMGELSNKDGSVRLYASINEGGFIDVKGKIASLSPAVIGGSVAFDSGKLYTLWRYFKEKFPIEVADGEAKFAFDYRFDGNDLNATELSGLSFDLSRLRIIPKGESRNLLRVEGIHLREGKVFPLRKEFAADALEIEGVNLAARRFQNKTVDWVTYIEEIQRAFPEDENETKEPWKFRLNRFTLEKFGAEWSDSAPKEPYRFTLENGRIHAEGIESDPKRPLSVSIATDNLRLTRQKEAQVVAEAKGFAIEGIDLDREGRFVRISKVSLNTPQIDLKRLKSGEIDLTRYLYAAPSKREAGESAPWGYRLDTVELKNGRIGLVDELPSKKVAINLNEMIVNLRNLSSDPTEVNRINVSTRINGAGMFRLDGDLVRENLRSSGRFELKGINAALMDPYLESSTYASISRGESSVAGDYTYRSGRAEVKGKVALHDWVVNDSRDGSVLVGWQSIGATPFRYTYPDNRLKINQLAVEGFYINTLIDSKKVLNLSTLTKQSPAEANTTRPSVAPKNPFGIDIVKFLVHNSSATFSDLSLPLPFKSDIHDLQGSILGISTTKDVTTFVKLRGGVDQYGLAKVEGSLNTKTPKQFTDMKVTFENLDLQQYTPYTLEFLGYKIAGGKLFLNLGYKITDGKLNGANQVVIKRIELGEEREGGSPWPMRLVVALLEDSEGVIDIDLPVEGDVNSPDFKYGKVVWQVIGNLFTKAVTSPFKFLGSMMGIESDNISSIDFEGGSSSLLPPQQEKLDSIMTMLSKRPKLSLEIVGVSDSVNDGYALKEGKLVEAALKREKGAKIDSPQAIPLPLLESMADEVLAKGERSAIKAKLEESYPQESTFVRFYSTELIEKLIAFQTVLPQELHALATRRGEEIRRYLLKNPALEKQIILKGNDVLSGGKEGEVPVRLEIIVP